MEVLGLLGIEINLSEILDIINLFSVCQLFVNFAHFFCRLIDILNFLNVVDY